VFQLATICLGFGYNSENSLSALETENLFKGKSACRISSKHTLLKLQALPYPSPIFLAFHFTNIPKYNVIRRERLKEFQ
jgi:hypothetical protein